MILYLGNILSSEGLNPPPIESIKDKICAPLNTKLILASNKKNKLLRFFHMNFVYFRYLRKVSLIFIDVYSTQAFFFAFYFALISKIFALKYIPVVHGGNIEARIKKSKWMTGFVFKNSDKNITPSAYLTTIFKRNNFKVTCIPNSINFANYKFRFRQKIRPRIIWLRAFHNIYNPKMAIEVLRNLCDVYSGAKLTMIGPDKDGSLYKCKELSKKYGISNNIEFFGYLTKNKWINLAQDHDVFINTSTIDNLPVSILEMMALGLPVISTKVGGIPFILKDGKNSLLVENNDFKNMALNVERLIQEPSLAAEISMNAFKGLEPFSIKLVVPQWIKIIEKYLK